VFSWISTHVTSATQLLILLRNEAQLVEFLTFTPFHSPPFCLLQHRDDSLFNLKSCLISESSRQLHASTCALPIPAPSSTPVSHSSLLFLFLFLFLLSFFSLLLIFILSDLLSFTVHLSSSAPTRAPSRCCNAAHLDPTSYFRSLSVKIRSRHALKFGQAVEILVGKLARYALAEQAEHTDQADQADQVDLR